RKIMPETDRLIPVDRRVEPRGRISWWIRHDMGGRECDAVEVFGSLFVWKDDRLTRCIGLQFAMDGWQGQRRHACSLYREVRHVEPAPFFPALHAEFRQLNALDALHQAMVPGCFSCNMTDEIFPLQFEAILVDDVLRHFLPL